MIQLVSLLGALLVGTGLQVWLPRRPGAPARLLATCLWGILGTGLWLMTLTLSGLRWSPALLAVPPAMGALLLAAARARRVSLRTLHDGQGWDRRRWALVAAGAALSHAVVIAALPAFGWDFRYIWGLKARVTAATGGHVAAWLAWPGHAFAHPDYPPLWPDLIAGAVTLGADAARSASLWQGVLALALAAACWYAAAGAPPRRRALAAIAGAWSPVIFLPCYSGYAEPLLALAVAITFGGLVRLAEGQEGALLVTAAGLATMSLTKNEGLVLALAALVGASLTLPRRWSRWLAIALVPALLWWVFLLVHGIGGETFDIRPAFVATRVIELPAALGGAMAGDLPLVALVWLLVLPALVGSELRATRITLTLWGLAVLATYLVGVSPIAWRMANSLDRVLATPLAATLALALRGCASRRPRGGGPPSPAVMPGPAPSG
ncbi:MAG: hypothetical protein ACM3O7_01065 [Acidobacteriota bacterium]